MELDLSKKELEELANQLSCPSGANGLDVASMMHKTNISMTINTIEQMQLLDGQAILELGQGSGAHVESLMTKAKDLTYAGLDISELMKTEAEQLNAAYLKTHRASFYLYDGLQIPFEVDSFNQVFTVNTIYFWTDPAFLLKEIYRVLKPGGGCHIAFAQQEFMKKLPFVNHKFELYTTEKVQELVAKTNFKWKNAVEFTETIKSKTGEDVERSYTIISLMK